MKMREVDGNGDIGGDAGGAEQGYGKRKYNLGGAMRDLQGARCLDHGRKTCE
jgi:hypothetical protein